MCGFKFVERRLYEALMTRHAFTDDWFFATQLAVRASKPSERSPGNVSSTDGPSRPRAPSNIV
jgi:hypothetical protein